MQLRMSCNKLKWGVAGKPLFAGLVLQEVRPGAGLASEMKGYAWLTWANGQPAQPYRNDSRGEILVAVA